MTLPLPDSIGVFPYLDVAAKQKANAAFIITVGVPLKADENPTDISVDFLQDAWIVDVLKDEKKIKLKIFDRNELPEFEIVDYLYKP